MYRESLPGAFLIVTIFLLVGCFGFLEPPKTEPPSEVNITSPQTPNPSFSVLSPSQYQTSTIQNNLNSTNVTISLSLQNLVLKQPGGNAKKGEGHIKATLDDGRTFSITARLFVIDNVVVGNHTLRLELLNNDRTSYSPKISREVRFTIERETPSVYSPKVYTVEITEAGYVPAKLTLKAGDRINFINRLSFPHSAISLADGEEVFNTRVLAKDQNVTVRVTKVGEFEFYSATKPNVRGNIVIEG